MKQYPSIPHAKQAGYGRPCLAFDKLDGSNIRAEWNGKRGWCKFGARTRMIDERDEQFGHAVVLFQETLADELERRFREREWKKLGVRHFVVFCEYVGPNSFAGYHPDPAESMQLVLFDVNPAPRGFLPPKEFLARFGDLPVPRVVYEGNFNRELVERVRLGELDGVTFEGIVAKGVENKQVWMAKAKSAAWIDRLRSEKGIGAVREEFNGQIPDELAATLG